MSNTFCLSKSVFNREMRETEKMNTIWPVFNSDDLEELQCSKVISNCEMMVLMTNKIVVVNLILQSKDHKQWRYYESPHRSRSYGAVLSP